MSFHLQVTYLECYRTSEVDVNEAYPLDHNPKLMRENSSHTEKSDEETAGLLKTAPLHVQSLRRHQAFSTLPHLPGTNRMPRGFSTTWKK